MDWEGEKRKRMIIICQFYIQYTILNLQNIIIIIIVIITFV